jgi:hypothetical protein
MSTNAGAAGAFGLYLPQFELLADLYAELQDYVKTAREEDSDEEAADNPEDLERIPEFQGRFHVALLEKYSIVVPPGAYLMWTGTEDDRPARCDTPSEEWVFGWGLLTKPWDYPEIDASFRKEAEFHTWVWMG